jgi:hypothetical protein
VLYAAPQCCSSDISCNDIEMYTNQYVLECLLCIPVEGFDIAEMKPPTQISRYKSRAAFRNGSEVIRPLI